MPEDSSEVATRFFTYGGPGDSVVLRSGARLTGVTLAYETYGKLAADASNAILLFHAMTGSQHAAGWNPAVPGLSVEWNDECKSGWWDAFIGPGKALDTDKYFIICANYLGGCYGSTGPSSINPSTNAPFGASFPRIDLADIVDSQVRLLDHFGIQRLHAVCGASIGGLMSLDFSVRYRNRTAASILIACGMEVQPLQRLMNFEQIFAIESDGGFLGGDYLPGPGPARGLALARIIAHKTFISFDTLGARSRDEILVPGDHFGAYPLTHPVESYMLHQANKFVPRFDANSYLRIVEAWQRFDLPKAAAVPDLEAALRQCAGLRMLVFSIASDVCFYPEEQESMVECLAAAGASVRLKRVESTKGHDSFLLEPELYEEEIQALLG
jgi:homoserine O-acetyltransferase/O-succinyltransferase